MLNDLLAGLVVAIISIPNGLGGSILAAVNPVHGLYVLIIGTPMAALFTGSALMKVDASSATALMPRDALSGIRPDQNPPALVMLVILVDLFQIVFGLLRLGSLVRFISNAVKTGLLTGIATLTNGALAGMLVVVGASMFNLPRIQVAWKTGAATQAILALTFIGTLSMPFQYVVFVGVALHVVVNVYQSSELTCIIQIVPPDDGGLMEAPAPKQLVTGEIVVVQPVGSLFFAGAAEVEKELPKVGETRRAVVTLRLRAYDEIGSTFLGVMDRYSQAVQANDGC